MSKSIRYHVLAEKDGKCVSILDSQMGIIDHPACWQDLAAYYHYLVGRGRAGESQCLLSECMIGHKPITTMLARFTQPETTSS